MTPEEAKRNDREEFEAESLRIRARVYAPATIADIKPAPAAAMTGTVRTYTHAGQTLSLVQWASKVGMKAHHISARLLDGYSFADAIEPSLSLKSRSTGRQYVMGGESLTLAQWSLRVGINQAALKYRLRVGMSLEQALTTPRMTSNRPWSQQVRGAVAKDFRATEETGAWSLAQDIPEIEISE